MPSGLVVYVYLLVYAGNGPGWRHIQQISNDVTRATVILLHSYSSTFGMLGFG